jgi:acyl carrier protein
MTRNLWHFFRVLVPVRLALCQSALKMNDINVKIHQFIEDKLGVDKSVITNSASFYDDLEVDSLDFCELIVDVEKEFNMSIPDDQYERMKTVGSLVSYVAKHVNHGLPKVSEINIVSEERLSA